MGGLEKGAPPIFVWKRKKRKTTKTLRLLCKKKRVFIKRLDAISINAHFPVKLKKF